MNVSESVRNTIGRALGKVPSGVYILTARHEDQSTAMMASWVQQVAFDPPAVSVAVSRGRPIADMIRASGRFALSILGDGEEDSALMKRFARGVQPGEDPFAGVKIRQGILDLPILADALACLECEVLTVPPFDADHELFVARVVAGEVFRDGPAFTHQRGNGFHY